MLEGADESHPFRLATSPARSFLNSTFTETPGSLKKEGRPTLMLHPDDAAGLGIADGDEVEIGNRRGSVFLHAVLFDGVVRGVVIAESIWPNSAHEHGAASTRSPARTRPRPSAARPSTTTRSGCGAA